jgi:hypothetical protein
LSKTHAQLAALGAISTKTYTFGPFPAGCYLLGGSLEVSDAFDAGLSPTLTIGTVASPLCCVDTSLAGTVPPTSFNYIPALGGFNPSEYVGGSSVVVTVAVGSGNFTSLTTGNFNAVILVSAPLQTVAAS